MGAGPERLIERHDLAGHLDGALHRVSVETIEVPDLAAPEIARTFELNRRLAGRVRSALHDGAFPLVVAGNCNSSVGTVGGVGAEDLGVVWFDAHADFDTPDDNASGFFDVMALATLTGSAWRAQRESIEGFRPVREERVVLVGARDLEPYQRRRLEDSRVRVLWGATDGAALARALDDLRRSVGAVYLHVDLDALDPAEGRANAYAAPGGLSLAELEAALQAVRRRFHVRAAAITAYDPGFDEDGRVARAALRVARAVSAPSIADSAASH
jgi:arginase